MPIERVTNRSHRIYDAQLTTERTQESAEKLAYGVNWLLPNSDHGYRNSKLTSSFQEASERYEFHKGYAVFVELWEFGCQDRIVRRFCNMQMFRQKYKKRPAREIFGATDPLYEIAEE